MHEFRMPALGADMEKGTVVQWHVKSGDVVHRGDIVADVETEKGTIEVEIWEGGTIETLVVGPGQEVPVGTVLARVRPLVEELGVKASAAERSAAAPAFQTAEPTPVVRAARHTPAAPPVSSTEPRPRLRASPLARKVAAAGAVDLGQVSGSGPGGAITRSDVEQYLQMRVSSPAPPPSSPRSGFKPDAMRHAIAQAMSRSKREIPHYYLQTEVNMAHALAWLAEYNHPPRPVTDRLLPIVLGLKAIARTVREFPELNGFFVEGSYDPQASVHLGVGISLRAGGLVAPAIHDADRLSVADLMRRLMDLIARARAGKLRSSEVSDATITVTNLGDQSVDTVFGVIYPPQVALIGMGQIRERPWAERGMVGAAPVMTLTLSADHRVSDGHRGARFLSSIDRLLQSPEAL